ncbi:MAG: hypothetical protein R3B70_24715 [Polyangiaceae bacterium]
MENLKTWAYRMGLAAAAAGALLSRDACLGGSKRPDPPPEPNPTTSTNSAASATAPLPLPPAPSATTEPLTN